MWNFIFFKIRKPITFSKFYVVIFSNAMLRMKGKNDEVMCELGRVGTRPFHICRKGVWEV